MSSIKHAVMAAIAAAAFTAPARAEIVIGLATALTGPVAAIGDQARRGAEAAIDQVNARGGVLGEKLRLEIADDACDPKQAVSVANQLVTKKVAAVLGHLCSGASIAAADVYAEEGLVMITASATNPTLTERGHKTIFRANGRDDQQGAIAGAMLAKRYAGKRIALIHDKSAYGKGLADEAAATLKAKGMSAALATAINAGDKDFSAVVTRLKADRIDVVYFGGYHAELGQMVRQAREQKFAGAFAAGEAMSTSEYYAMTGTAGDGTLFTYAPAVKVRPAARQADAAIRARGGSEPDNFAFYYYAAVEALAGAIAEAKSPRSDSIAEALRRGRFATIVGQASFDAKGDLEAPEWEFYEWRGGKYALAKLD